MLVKCPFPVLYDTNPFAQDKGLLAKCYFLTAYCLGPLWIHHTLIDNRFGRPIEHAGIYTVSVASGYSIATFGSLTIAGRFSKEIMVLHNHYKGRYKWTEFPLKDSALYAKHQFEALDHRLFTI